MKQQDLHKFIGIPYKFLESTGQRAKSSELRQYYGYGSKSFAEYLNENSDILMAIIGKQQAMGRGTRR